MMKYVIYVMIWIYRVSFLQTFRVFHSTEGFIIDPLRWFKETKPEWDVEDTSWGLQNGVLYFRLGILIIRVGTLSTRSMSNEYYAFNPTTIWRVWNSIDRRPFPTCGIWWPFLEEIVGTSATTVVGSLMTQSDGDNQAAGKLRKPIDVRIVEIDVLRYKVWIWMNNLRAKMRI